VRSRRGVRPHVRRAPPCGRHAPTLMATDQNVQERRRQHPHRGRRGHERRSPDRRPAQAQQGAERSSVDIESIMREIRARIAERHGVELSADQIQELAAHRLDAILDPRGLPPALLETLRGQAGSPAPVPTAPEPLPAIGEDVLLGPKGGFMHGLRRLLAPLLRLVLDPHALTRSLQAQQTVIRGLAAREAERERRQAEWNALHYEILQRLATEITRVSLEMQSLSLRVESLAGRVDFADRRVRGLEGAPPAGGGRALRAAEPAVAVGPVAIDEGGAPGAAGEGGPDGPRRKRRRRRGRKPGTGDRPLPDAAASGGESDEPDELGVSGPTGEEPEMADAARPAATWTPDPDPLTHSGREGEPEPPRFDRPAAEVPQPATGTPVVEPASTEALPPPGGEPRPVPGADPSPTAATPVPAADQDGPASGRNPDEAPAPPPETPGTEPRDR
jgi:hypothetical protein